MRVVLYDRTGARGLSPIWRAGSVLYRALRRADLARGADTWDAGLGWLATLDAPIRELQLWGHGRWGRAFIAGDVLDARALSPRSPLRPRLEALRAQLAPDALVWFRTCETFGARAGHDFASRLADFLGARVAGHTFVIHFHQSGACGLAPGTRPHWSASEGLAAGTPDAPLRARLSTPWAPRTLTCLDHTLPAAWFG